MTSRKLFFLIAGFVTLACAGVTLSGCDSASSELRFEVAEPAATQTPLPAVPTPTPTPSPAVEPTATPTPTPTPEGVPEGVKLPELTLNEPFSWPTNGMENVTDDRIALALWQVIESENVPDLIFGPNNDELNLDHPAWLYLKEQIVPGYAQMGDAHFKLVYESGNAKETWDTESEFTDFRVLSHGGSGSSDPMILRLCLVGSGDIIQPDGTIEDSVGGSFILDYFFDITGLLPALEGSELVETLSETEMLPCALEH